MGVHAADYAAGFGGITVRICVLGNSHAAALKLGGLTTNPPIGSTVDYFASRGRWSPKIKIIDGRIFFSPRQDKDRTTVAKALEEGLVISDFDAFVVSACGWPGLRNEYLEKNPLEHPLGHLQGALWLAANDESAPISTAVFSEIVYQSILSHPTISSLRLLKQHFSGHIIIQPWPAPSRDVKADAAWYLSKRFSASAPDAWLAFFGAQYAGLGRIARELGPNVHLLPYPEGANVEDGFMDRSLCAKEDQWHGNGKYGALVLDQVFALL